MNDKTLLNLKERFQNYKDIKLLWQALNYFRFFSSDFNEGNAFKNMDNDLKLESTIAILLDNDSH